MDDTTHWLTGGRHRMETLSADENVVDNFQNSLYRHHLLWLVLGPTKGGGKDYGEFHLFQWTYMLACLRYLTGENRRPRAELL